MTFTKLFSSITASTVWLESSDTRVVWITMLAMADRQGRVWASIPGLAKEAVVSVESCRRAIAKFLAPDTDSRTKVQEGRRIEEIDGGWRLINHGKYRAIRDQEERRAYKAEKQREYRAVDNVDKCGQSGPPLTAVDRGSHNAEAEAEAEAIKTKATAKKKPSQFSLPGWINPQTWKDFEEMRGKIRAPLTDRARQGIVDELEKIKSAGGDPEPVLLQSITKAWRGVFPLNTNGGSNGTTSPNHATELFADDQVVSERANRVPPSESERRDAQTLLREIRQGKR